VAVTNVERSSELGTIKHRHAPCSELRLIDRENTAAIAVFLQYGRLRQSSVGTSESATGASRTARP
jgi:hypothetical protein